jgi:prepilin-type N-terminal cleavage/methylation domain-containing protein
VRSGLVDWSHVVQLSRTAAGEDGFTLVEMLVSSAAAVILLSGVVMILATTLHSQPRVSERSSDIQQGRTVLEPLVRELRQGSSVVSGSTASSLSLITYVPTTCDGATSATPTRCRVNYVCAAGACTRTVRSVSNTGTAPARTIVTGLSTSSVFSYSPSAASATFVSATLVFPSEADGGESVTLTDGSALRNLGL